MTATPLKVGGLSFEVSILQSVEIDLGDFWPPAVNPGGACGIQVACFADLPMGVGFVVVLLGRCTMYSRRFLIKKVARA